MSPHAPARRWDPLTEIVFASTTPAPGTDTPADFVPGTRTRRGNAVLRTRAAILQGARAAVGHYGVRITMAQVAAEAGVAKATLYNHFRDRDEVLSALLADEVDAIIRRTAHLPLAEALSRSAELIRVHPLLDALTTHSPVALISVCRVDISQPGWLVAAEAIEAALARAGRRGTPTVLRWFASLLLSPADDADLADDLAVLLAGLPTRDGR